jgi:hypothetical protein
MAREVISFVLRAGLVAANWAFVWQLFPPTSRQIRILRAGVLSAVFVCMLVAIRAAGN